VSLDKHPPTALSDQRLPVDRPWGDARSVDLNGGTIVSFGTRIANGFVTPESIVNSGASGQPLDVRPFNQLGVMPRRVVDAGDGWFAVE
jgi:hypothetical protein